MSADNQQNTARGAALVTEAFRLADEVLFPAAGEVDRTSTIPDSHWKTLADAGFYGIALPAELTDADGGSITVRFRPLVAMTERTTPTGRNITTYVEVVSEAGPDRLAFGVSLQQKAEKPSASSVPRSVASSGGAAFVQ